MEYTHMEAKDVISLRRDSVVYRNSDGYAVKSYQPENLDIPQWEEVYGGQSRQILASHPQNVDYRRWIFNHEAAMLCALSGLDPRRVPQVQCVDRAQQAIIMEYCDYPTFQDEFLQKKKDNAYQLTEDLVGLLAQFDNEVNPQLLSLRQASRFRQRERLRPRNLQEEVARWQSYLSTIIYFTSSDLEEYWNDKGINPDNLQSHSIRSNIYKFLETKRLDLSLEVRKFITRSRNMTQFGKKRPEALFTAGDFGPQNTFYIPQQRDDEKKFIVYDFDKTRLDGYDVDLISTIYNIHRYPFNRTEEGESFSLARTFFSKVGIPEELIPERLAVLLASRIKQSIRLFSVCCQMNGHEVYKFLGRKDKNGNANLNSDVRREFLNDMFVAHFVDFLDFYRVRRGEGWAVLEQMLFNDVGDRRAERTEMLGQVADQIDSIERIFSRTGVFKVGKMTNVGKRMCKELSSPLI